MAAKKDIQDIQEGELVMLVSGSISMTVTGITYNREGQITHLECAWGDYFPNGDQVIKEKKFPVAALTVYRSAYELIKYASENFIPRRFEDQ